MNEYQANEIEKQREKIFQHCYNLKTVLKDIKETSLFVSRCPWTEHVYALTHLVKVKNDMISDLKRYHENIQRIKNWSLDDTIKRALDLVEKNRRALSEIEIMLRNYDWIGHERYLQCIIPNLVNQSIALKRVLQ